MDGNRKRYRLAVAADGASLAGGASRSLYLFLKYTSLPREETLVLLPEPGPMEEEARALGYAVKVVDKGLDPTRLAHYWYDPRKVARKVGFRAVLLARYAALFAGRPPDVFYVNTIRSATQAVGGKLLGARVVWHLRGLDWSFSNIRRLRLLALRACADRVVSVSHADAGRLREAFPGSEALRRLEVLPNGLPLDEVLADDARVAELRRAYGLEGGFVVGYLGRITPSKGVGELLDAVLELAPRLPELRLLLVGPPGESGEDQALAERVRRAAEGPLRGRVVTPGYTAEVYEHLSLMDLFCLPSHAEGFPRSLLEAMALGRPALATRVGDIPRMLEEGEAGLLFEARDAAALARHLETLARDPELRQRLGRKALEASKKYDIRDVTARLDAILREELVQAGRRK